MGLSQSAFAAVANAAKRTQISWEQGKIGVDVAYIITGVKTARLEDGLASDEELLLTTYRSVPQTVRNAALAVLLSGGSSPAGVDTTRSRKGTARIKQKVMGDNRGIIAGGNVTKE